MNPLESLLSGFERLDSLSVSERFDFFKNVTELANVRNLSLGEIENSICPYTKKETVVPCQLNRCMFWVEREGCNNCALNFLMRESVDKLSVQQFSYLYQKSPQRVESIFKRCFKIVQRHYLKTRLRELKVPRFTYQPGFCVACESRLLESEKEPTLMLGNGFGYCQASCKKDLPPLHFEIERFFESEFKHVLAVACDMFTTYYVEEILGFQPNILRGRLEKQKKVS